MEFFKRLMLILIQLFLVNFYSLVETIHIREKILSAVHPGMMVDQVNNLVAYMATHEYANTRCSLVMTEEDNDILDVDQSVKELHKAGIPVVLLSNTSDPTWIKADSYQRKYVNDIEPVQRKYARNMVDYHCKSNFVFMNNSSKIASTFSTSNFKGFIDYNAKFMVITNDSACLLHNIFFKIPNVVTVILTSNNIFKGMFLQTKHIFPVDSNEKLQTTNLWNGHEFLLPDKSLFPEKALNLNGYRIKVVLPIPSDPSDLTFGMSIMNIISQKLNFSYTLKFPTLSKDNFAYIGDLVNGFSDISCFPLRIAILNFNFLEMVVPSFAVCYKVVYPKPSLQIQWYSLFTTFSMVLWILVVVSVITVPLISFAILKFHEKYVSKDPAKQNMNSFTGCVFNCISVLLLNSCDYNCLNRPNRFFNICWVLFSLLIATAFVANLKAVLTTPKEALKINSFKELSQSGILFSSPGFSPFQILEASLDKYAQDIMRKTIVTDPVSVYEMLFNGTRATVTDPKEVPQNVRLMNWTEDVLNKVHFMDDCVYTYSYSYNMPLKSIIKNAVNCALNQLLVSGIFQKFLWDIRYDNKLPLGVFHKTVIDNSPKAFKLDNVKGIFMIWAFGIIVAISIVVVEIAIKKCKKHNKI